MIHQMSFPMTSFLVFVFLNLCFSFLRGSNPGEASSLWFRISEPTSFFHFWGPLHFSAPCLPSLALGLDCRHPYTTDAEDQFTKITAPSPGFVRKFSNQCELFLATVSGRDEVSVQNRDRDFVFQREPFVPLGGQIYPPKAFLSARGRLSLAPSLPLLGGDQNLTGRST
ncbi:MAG: hypothetical protein COT73_02190 [Bdellovibrio sp. CG10_big_fil_rev_8_21_14_0_10_47_8]|nr:MAG: hypothetical protein COT73_02190 [Bdellovibrio sp. CG10_big_fil_rev_8_21_14_0_10_47_8]